MSASKPQKPLVGAPRPGPIEIVKNHKNHRSTFKPPENTKNNKITESYNTRALREFPRKIRTTRRKLKNHQNYQKHEQNGEHVDLKEFNFENVLF